MHVQLRGGWGWGWEGGDPWGGRGQKRVGEHLALHISLTATCTWLHTQLQARQPSRIQTLQTERSASDRPDQSTRVAVTSRWCGVTSRLLPSKGLLQSSKSGGDVSLVVRHRAVHDGGLTSRLSPSKGLLQSSRGAV